MSKSCQDVWEFGFDQQTYFFSEFQTDTKHLMPWKNPQGFRLPQIQKQLKMVPVSDLVALLAHQLGVGSATNLGVLWGTGIRTCSSKWPIFEGGLTSNFPPHLCSESGPGGLTTHLPNACQIGSFTEEKLKKIQVLEAIFRVLVGEWEISYEIYQCPVSIFRNVATAEQLKDYEWLPSTAVQHGAVIRRRWLRENLVRSLTFWQKLIVCATPNSNTEVLGVMTHRYTKLSWGYQHWLLGKSGVCHNPLKQP